MIKQILLSIAAAVAVIWLLYKGAYFALSLLLVSTIFRKCLAPKK